jgi:hypothetical protein
MNRVEAFEKIHREVFEKGNQEGYGFKAYAQIRKTISYISDKFIVKFPKLASLVSETIISKEKIKGLIKGKLLKEEDLLDCQEVKETKAFFLEEESK